MDFLSTGRFRLSPRRLLDRSLCHGLMRHFLCGKLGLSVTKALLPGRVQALPARRPLVAATGSPQGSLPLPHRAERTQPLTAVAPPTEALHRPANRAAEKPVLVASQSSPCRRFLDMELRP